MILLVVMAEAALACFLSVLITISRAASAFEKLERENRRLRARLELDIPSWVTRPPNAEYRRIRNEDGPRAAIRFLHSEARDKE